MPPIPGAVRDNTRKYGLVTIVTGIVLLLALRLWTSPVVRRMTGRSANGLVEFLLIPVFFGVVTVGVLLFLWEPDADRR